MNENENKREWNICIPNLTLFINVMMVNRWSPCSETHCHVTHHKNTRNEDLCVLTICIGTVVL